VTRRTGAALGCAVVAVLLTAGCTSAAGGADPWSRTYLVPAERVFAAALDALDESGFHVDDAEEDTGRIRARSSARRGDGVSLLIRVETRSAGTRLSVMAGSPDAQDGRGAGPLDRVVHDLLDRVDDLLVSAPD
jgi:hypothetical protein